MLPARQKGGRIRPGSIRVCDHQGVLLSLSHAFATVGIPPQYWERVDMIIGAPLARVIRRVVWTEWLVLPLIQEGDTVQDVIRAVIRARGGR